MCSVDLSDLAVFNSAYGDARGDEIIIQLSKIIRDALKRWGLRDDFVGHLGGDDFIILTRSDVAVAICKAIIQNFDLNIMNFYDTEARNLGYILQKNKDGILKQHPVMTVSIAIVQSDRVAVTEVSQIAHITSELKKRMKLSSGSCYFNYEPGVSQGSNVQNHLPLAPKPGVLANKYGAILNSIIRGRKIHTVYQPIINLKTKKIVGYEALTRALTDSALDNAMLLFDVARDTEKVKELDRLCIEFALKNAQSIEPGRKLFLNLNHETLLDTKLMAKIFENRGVIDFKNIVIEVTEQSILRSFEKIRRALESLKVQGVSVAIDDVGGGAVSLRDVAILKPDYIKFDRSLIRQIDSSITKQQIVLSMILFANGIQAITTAEGIETKEEYQTVLICGISLAQGYYFARPGDAFPQVADV